MKNEIEKLKHGAYFLTGWKLFVYRIFIEKVYPDWKKGWENHEALIRKGYIAHAKENNCPCQK